MNKILIAILAICLISAAMHLPKKAENNCGAGATFETKENVGPVISKGATVKETRIEQEIKEMSTSKLNELFKNPVKSEKLMGETIIITGKVKKIKKTTFSGEYVITLGIEGEMGTSCFMSDSEKDKISELEIMQDLKIKGKNDGKMITVNMIECEIMD